jgi:hypothetical protein
MDTPPHDGAGPPAAADEPMDDEDAVLLQRVAALYDTVDPLPPHLVERIGFALALDEVFGEVAQITRHAGDAMAVRHDEPDGTRTETITFAADRLTAMVTTSRMAHDRVRLDGWLAPPGPTRVRLRMEVGDQEVTADESGRFSFADLTGGFAQLSFHPLAPAVETDAVVTPLFQL